MKLSLSAAASALMVFGFASWAAAQTPPPPPPEPPPPPPPAYAPPGQQPAPAPTPAPTTPGQPPAAPPPGTAPAPGAPPAYGPGYPPPAYGPGYPPPGYGQGYPPPAYGPPPPGYGYGYGQPAVPPPPDPSIHYHDGFYLRLALGGGFLSDSSTITVGDTDIDGTISGGAATFDFAMGGTPTPGFVIGGGVSAASAPEPKVKVGSEEQTLKDTTVSFTLIGLFADYYFNPDGGAHLQALLGYGELSASNDDGDQTEENPAGFGMDIGVGYEWWIGEQWGLGVLGKLTYASLKWEDDSGLVEEKDTVLIPGVQMTLTFH